MILINECFRLIVNILYDKIANNSGFELYELKYEFIPIIPKVIGKKKNQIFSDTYNLNNNIGLFLT